LFIGGRWVYIVFLQGGQHRVFSFNLMGRLREKLAGGLFAQDVSNLAATMLEYFPGCCGKIIDTYLESVKKYVGFD
jgi:hypothetical protein